MFITFEGLDFSGKTTQAALLVEKLRFMDLRGARRRADPHSHQPAGSGTVHFLREPGGTHISERIREILLDKTSHALTATAEILLFSASRTQLVSEVILPALGRGEIVVCDRFVDSTTAYQGYGRGLDPEDVERINNVATLGLTPNLTIFIDIPVLEIEQRKLAAGLTFDRMEDSGREFYERVRAGFLEIAQRQHARFVVVNGMRPLEAVHLEIWHAVERAFANA